MADASLPSERIEDLPLILEGLLLEIEAAKADPDRQDDVAALTAEYRELRDRV